MSKKDKKPKDKELESQEEQQLNKEIQKEQIETEKTSDVKEQKTEDIIEKEVTAEQENSTENISKEKEEKVEKEEEDFQKKYEEMNDKYIRLAAEYDNYRRRTLKEKMELIKNGGEDVLKSILPVIDNFDRALKSIEESSDIEAVKDGIELIYKNFTDFLKQKGIVEIEALDKTLDTDLHEAIAQVPAQEEDSKGKIIDVIEKGYKINEKVLRFAKVVVAQ